MSQLIPLCYLHGKRIADMQITGRKGNRVIRWAFLDGSSQEVDLDDALRLWNEKAEDRETICQEMMNKARILDEMMKGVMCDFAREVGKILRDVNDETISKVRPLYFMSTDSSGRYCVSEIDSDRVFLGDGRGYVDTPVITDIAPAGNGGGAAPDVERPQCPGNAATECGGEDEEH